LANDFPALRTLVETARECTGKAELKVTHSADSEERNQKSLKLLALKKGNYHHKL
jgi:hypothetical protein